MLGQQGVSGWVCDCCNPKSGPSNLAPDQALVFSYVDDLKIHMNTKHSAALSSFQLPSLVKVRQRTMLKPWPACSVIMWPNVRSQL
jgi:hypothetical protein